jgi:hypothetical protein
MPGRRKPGTRSNAAGLQSLRNVSEMHLNNEHDAPSTYSSRSGARRRWNGDRIEREIVQWCIALDVRSERYPHIDIYAFGYDEAPLAAEVKSRKRGSGFLIIENWLGGYDALILRRNNFDPIVCLPWRVWARPLQRARRGTTT